MLQSTQHTKTVRLHLVMVDGVLLADWTEGEMLQNTPITKLYTTAILKIHLINKVPNTREQRWLWKEVVVARLQELSQHLP